MDENAAFKFKHLAASFGDSGVQYLVGRDFATGRGVKQHIKKAVERYCQAAAEGNFDAAYHLGLCFFFIEP